MNGALVMVDSNTGRAEKIERIRVDVDSTDATSYDSDDGRPEYFNAF